MVDCVKSVVLVYMENKNDWIIWNFIDDIVICVIYWSWCKDGVFCGLWYVSLICFWGEKRVYIYLWSSWFVWCFLYGVIVFVWCLSGCCFRSFGFGWYYWFFCW